MSDAYTPETESQSRIPMDASIPLGLLALAFIVLLGWQVSNSSTERHLLENAIQQQQPAVEQSQKVQQSLAKLANDLITAAQTDPTAKAIAAKYVRSANGAAPAASGS